MCSEGFANNSWLSCERKYRTGW